MNRESSGEAIRQRIKKYTLSNVWLIDQLEQEGVTTSRPELSNILLGKRTGAKADKIIEMSSEILNRYERNWQRDECICCSETGGTNEKIVSKN